VQHTLGALERIERTATAAHARSAASAVRRATGGYGTNHIKVFTMSIQGARRTCLTWSRAPTQSEEGGRWRGRSSPVRGSGAGRLWWSGKWATPPGAALRWSGEVGHASRSCSEVIRVSGHASGSYSKVVVEVGHASRSCSEVVGEVGHASGAAPR
jgi:hypothetical protein